MYCLFIRDPAQKCFPIDVLYCLLRLISHGKLFGIESIPLIILLFSIESPHVSFI